MVRKYFFNRNRRTEPPETVASQSANASASASVNSSDFGTLGQTLQQELLRLVAQANRLQIRCTVREGVLLVLTEHLLHVEPDPQHVFIILEQSVRELAPKLLASDPTCSPTAHFRPLPVRLYLRVAGYQQPYAFHSFTLEPTPETGNTPDEAVPVAPPIALASDSKVLTPELRTTTSDLDTMADSAIAEPIEQLIDQPINPLLDRPEIPAFSESPEPIAAVEPTANFTIITDADAFIAEPIDEPEPIPDEPAAKVLEEPVTESSELSSAELSPEKLSSAELSLGIVATPEVTPEEIATPDVFSESTEATDQATIAPAIEQPGLAETFQTVPVNPIVSDREHLEYSAIADTEISGDIEDDLQHETEQETLDEALAVDEITSEFSPDTTKQDDSEPFQTFTSEYEDTETARLSSIQAEQIAEVPEAEFFVVEQTSLDTSEPTINETEIDKENDSATTQNITSNQSIDTFAVEPTQDEVISTSEAINSEAVNAEAIELLPDSQNGISAAQENHSIANPPPITPIPFEDNQTPIIYSDQVSNRSTHNGSVAPPFTAASVPIRLIPAVQDSASSFDRFPLEVGRKPFRSRLTLANVLLTGAVGLFFVVGGVYVLTRPCVLSQNCEPLQQAQQLTQRALATIQTNASALEVVEAYDQLTQASQLLETIPVWSRYHQTAQTLKVEYSSKVEELSFVVKALNQANVAAKKSLSPPHPIQVWREVQLTWREAIALLQQVPTDSSVYALAQNKLSEYQSNLESINSRIIIEQNGLDRLESVKKAAEVTDARSQIVNTIESWQQTSDSWNTILDQLKRIPQGTMAHAEAQRLSRLYQLKLEDADNRRSQETRSAEAYNQAIGLAKQARSLDQQGQWSQAIDYWRQAITTIKQVPEATTYYNQAQTLLNSYLASLSQSEQSVKQITLMQTVEPQLERICGSYNLCTYTLTTEAIRVQLTSEYDQIVVQALRSAQRNSGVQAETAQRVNQFLQSLSSISKTAETPVELYSATGIKLGTYDLNRSDYVLP